MIGLLFNLTGFSSRSKSVWVLPLFLLAVLLVTRVVSFMTSNLYTLYFVYYSCMGVAIILSIAFMLGSLNALFIHGHDLKSELLFFKKLGYGTISQFIIKVLIVAICTVLLWLLCSFIVLHFSYRLLMTMTVVYSILLALRVLSISFKTSLVYYVAAIMLLLSFFYPVYVLPNPAYLFKGGLKEVTYYSAVYIMLYLIVGYNFFISSWRKECLGWMS